MAYAINWIHFGRQTRTHAEAWAVIPVYLFARVAALDPLSTFHMPSSRKTMPEACPSTNCAQKQSIFPKVNALMSMLALIFFALYAGLPWHQGYMNQQPIATMQITCCLLGFRTISERPMPSSTWNMGWLWPGPSFLGLGPWIGHCDAKPWKTHSWVGETVLGFLEEGNQSLCQAHLCICLGLLQEELCQPWHGLLSNYIMTTTKIRTSGAWHHARSRRRIYKSELHNGRGSNRLALQKRKYRPCGLVLTSACIHWISASLWDQWSEELSWGT